MKCRINGKKVLNVIVGWESSLKQHNLKQFSSFNSKGALS